MVPLTTAKKRGVVWYCTQKSLASHTYSIEDIKAFIESAKNRGIRVIPELDTPGHMNSLCEAFAQAGYEFCVKCKGNWWDKGQMNEFYGWGPFRPDLEENYVLVEKFLKEFRDVFKDELVHLGGDEVPDGCWMEDESVRSWAEKNGMTSHSQIMRYHLDKVYSIAKQVGFENYQVWNEAEGFNQVDPESDVLLKRVSEGSKLDKPILQSWLPWTAEHPVGYDQIVNRATNEGYDVVLSSGWYLDLDKYPTAGPQYPNVRWTIYYKINPLLGITNKEQRKRVIGGEVCMWSEYVDATNVVAKSFPGASAVAERLWADWESTSEGESIGVEDAYPRLDKFRCLLINRGIPAEPIGVPSSCVKEFDVGYSPPWVKKSKDHSGDHKVLNSRRLNVDKSNARSFWLFVFIVTIFGVIWFTQFYSARLLKHKVLSCLKV